MLGYRIDIRMNDQSVLRDANINDALYFAKGLVTRRSTKPGDKIELTIKEDPEYKKKKAQKKSQHKQTKTIGDAIVEGIKEAVNDDFDGDTVAVNSNIMNPPIEDNPGVIETPIETETQESMEVSADE